ncbi:MAG: DivIVA domain-containing protein [Actinobacteria bacterium]|nr:DivIVA domain-containing protein [Actinomycetota bacterium]
MAISFSRPDPASPAAVGSATFPVNRRGYDPAEVRDFLRMVAAELARLQERERFLESELRSLQTKGMSSPGRLDEETVTTLLGEEAARVLSTARDASVQIRNRAEESATRLVREAAEDAARIRESAQVESNRIRNDANSDAESEVELAKQQGRDMVFEAREYREKVLSELARRRDAARAQIEQLLHGRDRLLNAFERARIASEDVINGLEAAHDEPEMLVNLSPATGPLPAVLLSRQPDPTAPAPFDHETAVEVVSEPAVENAAVETAEDSIEVFDVEEHIVEEPIEVVPVTELDSTASESNVPFYDHALSDSELHAVEDAAVHPEVSNLSNMHPSLMDGKDASESSDETGPLATVVSLFDGRRSKKTKNVEPSTEEPHEVPTVEAPVIEPVADVVVAPVESDNGTSPNQQLSKTAVDDIFKRLRASSPASVTKAVEKKKSAESSGASAEPAMAPSARKPLAVTSVVEPEKFIHRDEVLSPIIETLAKKIKRVLADEQNAILEVLESKKRKIDVDVLLGSEKTHIARHTDALTDAVMKAAMEGAKTTKTARGSVKRVTPAAVMSAMGDVLEEHLVSSMRAKLESILSDCDGDRKAISEGVRNTYREWKMQRADDAAADIACASFVRGSVESLEPGTKVCWMVDPNGPACPDAEDNSLAGPSMCGEPFPTGHTMPPAHVGCRCIISPAH